MEPSVKPGRYRHFKGNEYEVLFCARHSETQEEMVVYRALCGMKRWNGTAKRLGGSPTLARRTAGPPGNRSG